MRILVVDDERAVRESLRRALELEGYEVELATDGEEALAAGRAGRPDAVILDVLMPGIDGLEVCRTAPAAGNAVPVLMLTARAEIDSRVAGLDAGADDYLPKPFALEELLARLRALLRRAGSGDDPGALLRFEDLELDPGTREVRRGGELDRADAHRVHPARAVPAQPASGAHAVERSSSASGATTSARLELAATSTSATCAARPRRAAARA